MRLALCLAVALCATGARAESLRDALTGNWAVMEGSQLASDAENIAAAQSICASPQFGIDRGLILRFGDGRFALEIWDTDRARHQWTFDKDVRGGKLDDGRIAMRFSAGGTPTHELTFWKSTIEGSEHSLLEFLGQPVESGIFLKCP